MKLKISIPQIYAHKVTYPRTDHDEIYIGYFVTLAKRPEQKNDSGDKKAKGHDKALVRKYVAKKISNVRKGVSNGKRWKPENLECVVDTGDSELLIFNSALYEEDSGRIYKKLKKSSDVLLTPDDFDWNEVVLNVPNDPTSWVGWVKCLWKLAVEVFNYFREDDLLGKHSFVIDLTKKNNNGQFGYRELRFKRYGGDYRVTLNIEKLDDDA